MDHHSIVRKSAGAWQFDQLAYDLAWAREAQHLSEASNAATVRRDRSHLDRVFQEDFWLPG